MLMLAGPIGTQAQLADETPDAGAPSLSRSDNTGHIATLDPSDIRDFDAQPPPIQRLLSEALRLTKLNLTYRYGSDDPASGGMDCSGTIHYLLHYAGVADPPRDSSEIYRWMWTQGRFEAVVSSSPDTFELSRLKPGDLLFWTGTYHVTRDPPVTHVMIYLGIDRHNGRRVMMGASEGRRFEGISRYGVSVFDFVIPRADESESESASEAHARFIGYGAIPGLKDATAPVESRP
jgi:hypothetical protein